MKILFLTDNKTRFFKDYPNLIQEDCVPIRSQIALLGIGRGEAIVITKIYNPTETKCSFEEVIYNQARKRNINLMVL